MLKQVFLIKKYIPWIGGDHVWWWSRQDLWHTNHAFAKQFCTQNEAEDVLNHYSMADICAIVTEWVKA